MTVTVQTLEGLERRITLSLAAKTIEDEVQNRLKRLARTVKADGFRPGKVPLSFVVQRYGYSVQMEVVNDQLGQAFADAARQAAVRVAGAPRIAPKQGAAVEGLVEFDATFEVYPEVTLRDLAASEVERVRAEVTDAAIDRTIEILRTQRRTFAQRAAGEDAGVGDRVTIDFAGTIDGEAFAGGKGEDFAFVIGEGQMLEPFDQAVRGMKVGQSKTFPLRFPDDYHGKEVAGKEADFLVTMKRIEAATLPAVDEALARSLGIEAGTVEALRSDVKRNLEREVRFRVTARNKAAAMEAIAQASEFALPQALVEGETERMIEAAREDMKRRGMKNVETAALPPEIFKPQAERRVRIGLAVGELVRAHGLQAKPEQLQAYIEEVSQSYENPAEIVRWYLSDRQRMAEVEAVVVENNVADHVFGKAKVTERTLGFDELMGR